jgi:tetratricopeptide (TPR) repeat protein
MGWIQAFFDWRWDLAEESFERALALDPNYATAWEWNGIRLVSQGRRDEGLRSMREAWRLDPLSLMVGTILGWASFEAGERELFYRDGHDLMAVAVDSSKGFTAGRPRALFKDTIPPWLNGGYDVSPDGQRFVTMDIEEDGAKRIVMLLDFFEELKRLAPTGR